MNQQRAAAAESSRFGRPALLALFPGSAGAKRYRLLVHAKLSESPWENKNAPVRNNRTDAFGKVSLVFLAAAGLFKTPAWPKKSQSRYRIWSVQNRSRPCRDLVRVANS